MPSERFETEFSASERSQTYNLDNTATEACCYVGRGWLSTGEEWSWWEEFVGLQHYRLRGSHEALNKTGLKFLRTVKCALLHYIIGQVTGMN